MQPLSPGIAVQQIVLSLILVGHIVILPPDVCLQPTESIMTNVQIISWIFQQYSNDQCIPIFIAKFNAVRNKQYLRVPSCLCSNCSLWFQSKERGRKNHTLIPFFVWPTPKLLFVGLLLRNQTEAKHHLMPLVSSRFSAQAQTDLFVCACTSSIYLVQYFIALFNLCILHLPTNLHPFIFLLKVVKQCMLV